MTVSATPRTSRSAISLARQAAGLLKGNTDSARRLKAIITQLNKGLQGAITDKEIGEEMHRQYKQRVENKPKAKTNDKRRITKAKVITTEDVLRMKEERETVDKIKKEKKRNPRGRAKKANLDEGTAPSTPPKEKKNVRISKKVIISLDSDLEVHEGGVGGLRASEKEKWSSSGESEFVSTPCHKQGKCSIDDQDFTTSSSNVVSILVGSGRVLRSGK